jgi:hypothetical protein
MPAQDVTVTANFEVTPLDHFKFYGVHWEAVPWTTEVQLEDQFGTINATVGGVEFFGNPVEKVHGDIVSPVSDPDHHLTVFWLEYEEAPKCWRVEVNNQFGENQELTVCGPVSLAVPTQKEGHEAPDCLDHFLVYEVIAGPPQEVLVGLNDQFTEEEVWAYEPVFFANPVQKTHDGVVTEIENEDEHLVFYSIVGDPFSTSVQIDNQISGQEAVDVYDPELLAVPSQKISWEQPLNHFKTYWADWPSEPPPLWEPPTPVDVQLEDQFVTINATVWEPYLFANPTFKGISEEDWTPIWDPNDHLTFYSIEYGGEPQEWDVTVNNQFGNGQVLRVAGPFYVAVPTQKAEHDPPVDLNHYLVYEVYWQEYAPKEVYIEDQFFFEGAWTNAWAPAFLAVPAQKIHGPVTTPIKDDVHLVFYGIAGIDPLNKYNLPVINQFGDQYLDVWEDEGNYLGVPSQKISWEGPYPYAPD